MPRVSPSILIVEDNAADAELAVEALADAVPGGVHVVRDGCEALDHLRSGGQVDGSRRPYLVLLDLNLPRHGGLETLTELKADPLLRRIPVVVLTTSKSGAEIDRSYELGAAAVLNKPLRLAEYRAMFGAFERFWLGHVRLPTVAV